MTVVSIGQYLMLVSGVGIGYLTLNDSHQPITVSHKTSVKAPSDLIKK